MSVATSDSPRSGASGWVTNVAIVIVVGVFATTLAQPQVLARLPLQNLLKNELHVDRTLNAAFFFWAGLPWYFKPFAGILTDAFPVFGSRRKGYLVIGAAAAAFAWFGLSFVPHHYNTLLWGCIVINAFMVIASTAVGGYMVETAQASSATGRLAALREFVQQICLMIRGPVAGFLASVAFGWTAGACGLVVFLLVPTTIFFLIEQRKSVVSHELLGRAGVQLARIARARTMWAAAGLTALFYMAPGLSTAVFYIQQNQLHLSTQMQGNLGFVYGVFGLGAALGYAFACRHLNLRILLVICLTLATLTNLAYLFYSSVTNAIIISGFEGFGFTLAELALMDLAVRATPAGSEGLGFSLMVSVRNLALFGTDWLGSSLLDAYHLKFDTLVIANAATTFATIPLVLLLPRVLVKRKDADLYEEAAVPATAIQQ